MWEKRIFGIDRPDGKVLVAVHAPSQFKAEHTAIVHSLFAKRIKR